MIYMALYILLTACSVILIHFIGNQMPEMLMVFLSTSYAIILFNLLIAKKWVSVYVKVLKQHPVQYIKLLIALLVMWIGTFLIPIYFMPSSLIITLMGITSLCGSFAGYLATRNKTLLLKGFLLTLNLCLFYLIYLHAFPLGTYVAFVLSTLVTGFGAFAYLKFSEGFTKQGFTAVQILALRFWLLWLVGLVCVVYNHAFTQFQFSMFPKSLLIGLVSLILPIYFLQKSIEILGGNRVGVLVGLVPVTTVIMQYIFIQDGMRSSTIFAFTLSFIIIGFYFYGLLNKKQSAQKV